MTSTRIIRVLLCALLLSMAGSACAMNWNYLDGPFGGRVMALASDAAGNTWAASLDSRIHYRAAGTRTWVYRGESPTRVTFSFPGSPGSRTELVTDNAGNVYLKSGVSGLYSLAVGATGWTRVSGTNGLPDGIVGAVATDAAGTLYAAVDLSVYQLTAGGSWVLVGGVNPHPPCCVTRLAVDSAGAAWATIDGVGVYKLVPGSDVTWVFIGAGLFGSVVADLIAVGSDLFAATHIGVFKLANAAGGSTAWVPWSGGELRGEVYALARGANDALYAHASRSAYVLSADANEWKKFGTGLESYFHSFALVYSSHDGSLTLGNDDGAFVLPAGGSTWESSVEGMPSGAVWGLVVAGNGDIYAAAQGPGVQRRDAGATTWTAVDPAHISPQVEAIAIDSQGTVFAAERIILPGDAGRVMKLVNGSWTSAGAGAGGCAATLSVDASDTLWAACVSYESGEAQLKVQTLATGASTWVSAAAAGPVQGGDGGITNVAVDAGGTAYVGSFGWYFESPRFGIYALAPGATTWTPVNAGLGSLDILALQRDAAGAVYAGTGDGVYKRIGGSWRKVGTGLDRNVNALVMDTNGDLYASTDALWVPDTGVWRLAAGTSTWTRVPLGLNGAVNALAVGGGRVYAGTGVSEGDAVGGAPSGVYILSMNDSVFEFYNHLLDHFFITGSAAEKDAILGGSAGPGWALTGNAFSAGGAAPVCRFYGSVSPGPNSHFYTIIPAECQWLQDLQAITPASEKRWNFESHDFASTAPLAGQCPANTIAVYRAYNDGFARGVDSNHRITSNRSAYQLQVAKGWRGEGVVMCAAQ